MIPFILAISVLIILLSFMYFQKQNAQQNQDEANKLEALEAQLDDSQKEVRQLKQELADVSYKCKELEKDLAAAKR